MTLQSSRKVRQESKGHGAYIHQEYSCNGKITIAHSEDYPSTTARMDISNVHQVSFMCRLYIATLMCWLYVQLTYMQFVCVACACSFVCSLAQYVCSVVLCSSIVVMCSTCVCDMYCSLSTKYCSFIVAYIAKYYIFTEDHVLYIASTSYNMS